MAATGYARVSMGRDSSGREVVLNARTRDMLAEAQRVLGGTLVISQGSYMAGHGAGASSGTHDAGGAVDLSIRGLPAGITVDRVVLALRVVGFAAWHRTDAQFGPGNAHIHAVALGDRELAPAAALQESAYRNGRNGLATNLPDDGPRVAPIRTWEQYRRKQRTVSTSAVVNAAEQDRSRPIGSHPRQVRLVQAALGMRLRTGRWGPWTRKAYAARFPGTHGAPTASTLRQLAVGHFTLVP